MEIRRRVIGVDEALPGWPERMALRLNNRSEPVINKAKRTPMRFPSRFLGGFFYGENLLAIR